MKGILLIGIVSLFRISFLKAQTYRYATVNGSRDCNGSTWTNADDRNHLQNTNLILDTV